jgi:ATP-dependent Clp protease ATP-binding subunit ClpX
MGFGAEIRAKSTLSVGEVLAQTEPEDLLKYGLIPELVGRLPVLCSLHELDHEALVRILKEPKNALCKQYQRFFEMENIALKFTDDALRAASDRALKRGTGARGLRAVLEEVMLDIMYEFPSRSDVKECVITRETVERKAEPLLLYWDEGRRREA